MSEVEKELQLSDEAFSDLKLEQLKKDAKELVEKLKDSI